MARRWCRCTFTSGSTHCTGCTTDGKVVIYHSEEGRLK